jgi:hypothetical protein
VRIRDAVLEHVELLSRPSAQLEYGVPGELVAGFCSDLYHPKSAEFLGAFTEGELKELAHLYGLLVEASRLQSPSVPDLLKQPQWRRVVEFAKDLAVALRKKG